MRACTSTNASSVTSCYGRARATAAYFARLGVSNARRLSSIEDAVSSARLWPMMTSNNAFESGRADRQRALAWGRDGAPAQRER